MFKHILVAIDSSPCSQLAMPAAIEMAKKFDSEVLVLHVNEHDHSRAAAFTLQSPAEATALVGDAVHAARAAGIAARAQVKDTVAGHVAKVIVEVAGANGIDLIVMGSRGLSDALGLMVGSVTHKVMRASDIPVLVVRPAKKTEVAANGVAKA